MIDKTSYRHHSEGYVKVYGNSIEIKEEYNVLTPLQKSNLIQEEYQESRERVWRIYDYHLKEHVLEHGQNFMKVPFWYDELLERKKTRREGKVTPERKKGDIQGFSINSRSRMLKRINQLNPDRKDQFYHITLTYPKRFPTDGITHKTDLDVFIKRLKRRFGKEIELLWKLEFQKRGAPHYHMIVYLEKEYNIQYLRKWLGKNWYEVAQRFWDEKLDVHKDRGVGCDQIDSLRKAGYYLSKYITKKEEETPANQGRFWGCTRNWGEVMLRKVTLSGKQLIHFRRLVKQFVKDNRRMQKMITAPMNLTVFGSWRFFLEALLWVKKVH